MSKEEAMKLPLSQRPLCFRLSSELYHAVFEAIGSASMCWKPRPGKEVFSSEEASNVAVALCFKVAEATESDKKRIAELEAMLERVWSWGMADCKTAEGSFSVFAEEIIPEIGILLGKKDE